MKLVFLLVLLPTLARAQDASPYLSRFMDHYALVEAYGVRTLPDSGASPEATLARVRDIAAYVDSSVAADRPATPAALRQLDAYAVLVLGFQLTGQPYGTPRQTWCTLWAEEMVPRFAADVARFVAEPTADHAALVWIPAAHNVVASPLPYWCSVSDGVWATFAETVDAVLSAAPPFLELAPLEHSEEAGKLRRALGEIRRAQPYVRTEGLRRVGDLTAAQATIELTMEASPWLSVWAAGRLARSLSTAGQTDAALSVLDRAAPLAPAAEVPADTVRAWYSVVSATEAERRFAAATAGPVLVPTDESVEWADGLVDLATGEPFDRDGLGDRLVLLDVWATWCGACIAEFPTLSRLAEERSADITVVAVSVDAATGGQDLEGVREVAEQYELNVITLYDPRQVGSLADVLNIGGYPARFLLGPDGKVYASRSGRLSVTIDEVEALLGTLP